MKKVLLAFSAMLMLACSSDETTTVPSLEANSQENMTTMSTKGGVFGIVSLDLIGLEEVNIANLVSEFVL